MKRKTALTVLVSAFGVFILAAVAMGVYLTFTLINEYKTDDFDKKIKGIEMIIDNLYLYDYDRKAARESAIKAYVESLGEPYTEYYTPDEFKEYMEGIEDGYTGIGIIVSVTEDDKILIISPFEGSPAYNAGIVAGDILKAVNGREYKGSELNEAVSVIKGDANGTSVDITVERDGADINMTIERGEIAGDSVKGEMLEDGIGYMRIIQFNTSTEGSERSTHTEFDEKFKELENAGMKKLIIDLRDNPGGLLTEACAIADKFLGRDVITYTETKDGEREYYKSDAQKTDIPVVILINENSASASEVFTGALKDYERATVVGKKSYGKGIVQTLFPLKDGGGLSVTTAKYYTPNGVCIHDIGIEPDVEIEIGGEYNNIHTSLIEHENDAQLKKAVDIIKVK